MKHNDYKAMIQAQDQQRDAAWKYILQNMGSATWQPIPANIRLLLGFHSSLGLCGGNLVTKTGSKGMSEFIQRMNRVR